ncbi:MAG: DUF4297 domain-containing protein [Deltaproteobacteria bacterium]|nr:DUF4297 domain-containing protein [Deltaproteobacteria bacterium]
MTADSGGSIAIKGFNYQKAVIAYIVVHNYQHADFYIMPEGRDDAEVFTNSQTSFVQIKSEKLTITKLVRQDKDSKKSILGKLFAKNCDNAAYKIVTPNSFAESDKKLLQKTCDSLLPCDVFEYSSEQKEKIYSSLKNEDYTYEQLSIKLKNASLVISPFEDNFSSALPYLLGVMSEANISIDGNRGKTALTELFTQIDLKSEIILDEQGLNYNKKKIKKSDLVKIFVSVDKESHKSELKKELLDNCGFSIAKKHRIKIALYSINSTYQGLKNRIAEKIRNTPIEEGKEVDQIKHLYGLYSTEHDDSAPVYAVIIELIADKIVEHNCDN